MPDAVALMQRSGGTHNLQGHDRSVIPLAVHYGRHHRDTMDEIRQANLDLNVSMDDGRSANRAASRAETRHAVWNRARDEMAVFVSSSSGQDIVAEDMTSGAPQSAADVARTYLSTSWGGGQPNGGGADTVVKRTLKLLAHLQIA